MFPLILGHELSQVYDLTASTRVKGPPKLGTLRMDRHGRIYAFCKNIHSAAMTLYAPVVRFVTPAATGFTSMWQVGLRLDASGRTIHGFAGVAQGAPAANQGFWVLVFGEGTVRVDSTTDIAIGDTLMVQADGETHMEKDSDVTPPVRGNTAIALAARTSNDVGTIACHVQALGWGPAAA